MRAAALLLLALAALSGCGPGVYHGPADPSTNYNPFTGSTGGGGGR